jgi:hypothetical protein
MTTPAKRAAPRKAAKAGGKGRVSGPPPALAAPEEFTPSRASGPYGNKKTFTYNPSDGDPIVFPHISEINADAHFFWKIYNLNEMFQAFEWMIKAGVPRSVQERVMLLPDAEKQEFFSGWFSAVTTPQGVAPPGES